MLTRIDDQGRSFEVKDVYNRPQFDNYCAQIKDFQVVRAYVSGEILPLEKFTVGTIFPKEKWENTPLMNIWGVFEGKMTNDEAKTQSGFLLGRIVQDIVIKDEAHWKCTGVDLQGRGFDAAFYWR